LFLWIILEENNLDEDENYIPPWEENDGYYGLLSRLVKTAAPDFIWSVRASYDTTNLNKDQMVNHYSRNGCFTTKVGLCSSLRNLPWFHSGCAEEFYPRCYKVTNEDEKVAFIGKDSVLLIEFSEKTIFLSFR
jgi:tubulin monoglycylase TTLL3/8